MRRLGLLLLGLLVAGGLGGFALFTAGNSEGSLAAGLYAGSMVAIVVGVLIALAGLQKDEGPAFDPGARLTEYPWSNDEQPWSIGEALGMSFWIFRQVWAKTLVIAPIAPLAGIAAAMLARAVVPVVAPLLLTALTPLTAGLLTREHSAVLVRVLANGAATTVTFALLGGPIVKLCLGALRSPKVRLAEALGALRHAPRLTAFAVPFFLLSLVPIVSLVCLPFILTPFFVVDQDLGLVAALRKSWRVGTHHLGKLWLVQLAFVPFSLLGSLTLIGTAITTPLFVGALAYAYVRLTGRSGMPYFPPDASSRYIRAFLRRTLLGLTAIFAGLIYWVESLPKMRGSAFHVIDAAVRASTIVVQVIVVVVMLALILPYVLDQLEGRRFTTFVAARHVRSQKSGFLTVISVLSICGVAISSCALSSVVGVMGGFSQDLRKKILGSGAHIVVDTTAGTAFDGYDAVLARVRAIPGVVGATPVVRGEVMASSASNLAGVVVTGVEPGSIHSVIDLSSNVEVGKIEYLEHPERLTRLPPDEVIGLGAGGERYYKGAELPSFTDDIDPAVREVLLPSKPDRPGLILGRELAKTLHVYVGDEVTLVSPLGDLGPMGVMPRTKKFRVAAIFYSGMYEYDATYVYTLMDVAQDYFQTGDKVSAIEIKVDDAERADIGTPLVSAAVGRQDLRIRDWREINKNLFSALKLERFATFIILSLAILVASFCIICTLLLMVTEKGKEIAILKAIGATNGAILRTFIIEGMIIGGIGMIFGVVTSFAFCTGVKWHLLLLPSEVYYIDRLPISVNAADFVAVAAAALTICALATLYPAYAASRLRPVDGLRDA